MPERPPSLRPAVQSYARGASALLNALMRLSAVALGLPETHFDDAFDPPKARKGNGRGSPSPSPAL
eukprot:1667638-Pleurochrysis_carterae.AAC.1